MKINFTNWSPGSPRTEVILYAAIEKVEELVAAGYSPTLRQLYYRLVAANVIANNERQYTNLGNLVKNARLGGWLDWDHIVDRGRVPYMRPQWDDPADFMTSVASQYALDRWEGQAYHVEVWCEKDALSSIFEPVARRWRVRMLAAKGYASVTAIYDAVKRFERAMDDGRCPVILYLGDHDPSGLDMTRDVIDRLTLLGVPEVRVERLALNMDQVLQYDPPPNPTKLKDSRAPEYIAQYGYDSWELDAMDASMLDALVAGRVQSYLDRDKWDERAGLEGVHKGILYDIADDLKRQAEEEAEIDTYDATEEGYDDEY